MGSFLTREQNDGEIDHRINVKGRPSLKGLSNRELREKELVALLRKLKPHVAKAIMTAIKVMGDENAKHSDQLAAANLILKNYKDTMESAYDKQYDDEKGEEINQDTTPLFSLKVINSDG